MRKAICICVMLLLLGAAALGQSALSLGFSCDDPTGFLCAEVISPSATRAGIRATMNLLSCSIPVLPVPEIRWCT